ncbi:hypothetical protein ACFQ08_06060 [Streptosporangium algeriense]|uniref:Uncharacterized protein n=1 Tax=Streptosporangium algeriense TaxID=1682748 RepID=A0ABW3DLM9_9ACTN
MHPSSHPWRRALGVLVIALALFVVVRDPTKAADLTTRAITGLGAVAESLAAFLTSL